MKAKSDGRLEMVYERGSDSLGSTALVRVAEFTLAAFKRLRIPLLPGNRLEQAVELIRSSQERRIDISDPSTALRVAAAVRDVWDFCVIASAMPETRDADREGKLKMMLRGRVGDRTEKSSKPRDFQFELLMGAVFAQGDIPTFSREPDLWFVLGGENIGAAVKRVRSPNRLAPSITAARKQIEGQHLSGIVIVDVEALLGHVPACATPEVAESQLTIATDRLRRLLPDLARHASLLGIVAMGRIVGWDFGGSLPRLCNHWFNYPSSFVESGKTEGLVDELAKRLHLADERLRNLLLRAAAAPT